MGGRGWGGGVGGKYKAKREGEVGRGLRGSSRHEPIAITLRFEVFLCLVCFFEVVSTQKLPGDGC